MSNITSNTSVDYRGEGYIISVRPIAEGRRAVELLRICEHGPRLMRAAENALGCLYAQATDAEREAARIEIREAIAAAEGKA